MGQAAHARASGSGSRVARWPLAGRAESFSESLTCGENGPALGPTGTPNIAHRTSATRSPFGSRSQSNGRGTPNGARRDEHADGDHHARARRENAAHAQRSGSRPVGPSTVRATPGSAQHSPPRSATVRFARPTRECATTDVRLSLLHPHEPAAASRSGVAPPATSAPSRRADRSGSGGSGADGDEMA